MALVNGKAVSNAALPKQVAMRSSAFKTNVRSVFRQRIDQNPIRFNVAVTIPRKLASQGMIVVLCGQRISIDQHLQKRAQFSHVLSPPLSKPHIFFELPGAAERSQSPRSR